MSATVFMRDGVPEIHSVATLTWREKRNPRSLTGFLASARATNLTVRFRAIEIVEDAASASTDPSAAAGDAIARTVEKIAKAGPGRRAAAEAAIVTKWDALLDEADATTSDAPFDWGDLARASGEASEPNIASAPSTASARPSSSSKKPAVQETLSWEDVAASSTEEAPGAATPADHGASGASGWDLVAEVSETVASQKTLRAADLQRGDVVVHPTLGNCVVLSVVSDHVVMIKPKNDASRKITTKPFDIVPSGKKGIYTLTKR